jgi:hypothetical protein
MVNANLPSKLHLELAALSFSRWGLGVLPVNAGWEKVVL